MSAKNIAMVLGVVFIVIGILGFVGGLSVVGEGGFFPTDTVHDVIHLVSGLILVFVAMKSMGSLSMTLKVLGIIYLLVTILGFVVGEGMVLGLFNTNMSDNILHLVLAVLLLWGGFMGNKGGNMMSSSM